MVVGVRQSEEIIIFNVNELTNSHGAETFLRKQQFAPPTKEFSTVLWNPKVHYRVNKSQPPVPNLSQVNPLHTTPSYFSKIHLNIILPPTSRSS
jgi:hypothetical protein